MKSKAQLIQENLLAELEKVSEREWVPTMCEACWKDMRKKIHKRLSEQGF